MNKSKRIYFNKYFKRVIKNIEKDLEIKDYTANNIRHTFIDNVYKEGTQNGLTILEMAAITGNKYKTAIQYYRKYSDIELYVEAMAQVIITDVDIFGNIIDGDEDKYYRIVKDNLGKCSNEHCVFDVGECLICKYFVTFLSRIPAFEDMIKHHNIAIKNSTNELKIQELNAQKKLLGRYLVKMYERERDQRSNL